MDGYFHSLCEVRLCDPCARVNVNTTDAQPVLRHCYCPVCARVPCVCPLYVCVPASPGVFEPATPPVCNYLYFYLGRVGNN
jgi:hypothetical protein